MTERLSRSDVAEQKLADAGVFAGAHGLRGFADADEFWEKQDYGTRLYYGPGNLDYIHRDVLRAALRLLDQPSASSEQTRRDPTDDSDMHDFVAEQDAARARDAALEEAAKVCERNMEGWHGEPTVLAEELARRIRALKEPK